MHSNAIASVPTYLFAIYKMENFNKMTVHYRPSISLNFSNQLALHFSQGKNKLTINFIWLISVRP
jgi:hypothetical protein